MKNSRLSWCFSVLLLCSLAGGCGGSPDGAGAASATDAGTPVEEASEPLEVITVQASTIISRPMSEPYSTSANLYGLSCTD